MNWNEVICSGCGLVENYKITQKGHQRVATCNGCGKFLGNKPKDEYNVKQIKMPFGKYQGQIISQVNDVEYFRWVLKNVNTLKGGLFAAIKWKVQ